MRPRPWQLCRIPRWSRPPRRPDSARRCGHANRRPRPRAAGSARRAPADAGERHRRTRTPTRRDRTGTRWIPASIRGGRQTGPGVPDPGGPPSQGLYAEIDNSRGRPDREHTLQRRTPSSPAAGDGDHGGDPEPQARVVRGVREVAKRAVQFRGGGKRHGLVHGQVDRPQFAHRLGPGRRPAPPDFHPLGQRVPDRLWLLAGLLDHARILDSAEAIQKIRLAAPNWTPAGRRSRVTFPPPAGPPRGGSPRFRPRSSPAHDHVRSPRSPSCRLPG